MPSPAGGLMLAGCNSGGRVCSTVQSCLPSGHLRVMALRYAAAGCTCTASRNSLQQGIRPPHTGPNKRTSLTNVTSQKDLRDTCVCRRLRPSLICTMWTAAVCLAEPRTFSAYCCSRLASKDSLSRRACSQRHTHPTRKTMTAIAADAMPAALFEASDICDGEQHLGAAQSV
jgi:hypothetical protein